MDSPLSLSAQERILNRDATELDLGNGKKQIVIQDGQNHYENGSWHRYDFSIKNEVSGSYDRKIENDFTIRFNTNSPEVYQIEKDGKYVEWGPRNIQNSSAITSENNIKYENAWSNVDLEIKPIPKGLKEDIILKNKNVPTVFQFSIATNLHISYNGSNIFFFDGTLSIFKVNPIFAMDGNRKFLDVNFYVENQSGNYFLTLSVDTAGAVFPIQIDPTITIYDSTQVFDNCTRSTTGFSDKEWGSWTQIKVGGDGEAENGKGFGLLKFDLSSIPENVTIDKAYIKLYRLNGSGSPGPCVVRRFKKQWGEGNGANAEADTGEATWNSARRYIENWQSAGALGTNDVGDSISVFVWTGSSTWDSALVTSLVSDWYNGTYNNYGVKLVIQPDPDYQSARFYYSSEYGSNQPRLIVEYTGLPVPLPPALTIPGSMDSTNTLVMSCVDSLNDSSEVDYAFKYTAGNFSGKFINLQGNALSPGDTVKSSKTSWQNIILKSLTANEKVSIVSVVCPRSGSYSPLTSADTTSIYTRAKVPNGIMINSDTDSTLKVVSFEPDSNPNYTLYAIYNQTIGKYVDSLGNHDSLTVWYTKSKWDSLFPVIIDSLTLGSWYAFKTKARNKDSIDAYWSATTNIVVSAPPSSPENLILIPSNVMTLLWTANSETDLKGYIVYRSTSYPASDSVKFVPKTDSSFVDSSITLGTTYYYWITAVDSFWAESGASDYVTGMPGYVLSIPDKSGYEQDTLKIPILTSNEMALDSIYSFEFHIGYDETVVKYAGIDTVGTLSSAFYTIQVHDTLGVVNIAAFDTIPIPGGNDTIIFLKFYIDVDTGSNAGHSDLIFASALIDDDNNYVYTSDGRISVKGLLYGDPSLNDSITTYDCSLVLQHNIAKKYLNGLQELVADVSGNGLVTVYDASLILKYVIGIIDSFPAGDTLLTKQSAPLPENSAITLSYSKDEENGVIIVDVSVSGAGDNISAIGVDIRYPKDKLEYDRYALTKLTEKFMAGVNDVAGVVKVGLASGHALESDGKIIRLYFRMKESNLSNPKFELIAAMLNETKINYVTDVAQEEELPKTFELSQNYPNPFNPETTIRFQIPGSADVKLVIYNILGQEVKTLVHEKKDAGYYAIKWDGTNNAGMKAASGIYIYRFTAGKQGAKTEFVKVRKMVFLK